MSKSSAPGASSSLAELACCWVLALIRKVARGPPGSASSSAAAARPARRCHTHVSWVARAPAPSASPALGFNLKLLVAATKLGGESALYLKPRASPQCQARPASRPPRSFKVP